MEKSSITPNETYQEGLIKNKQLLASFYKLANIKIPMYIRKQNRAMHISAQFKDTTLDFSSTSMKTMYSDCVGFIEEMNAQYIKSKYYLTKL